MDHLEYPDQGDFLECNKCKVRAILVESTSKERRERLVDFLEEHLATCYKRREGKS